MDHVRQTAEMVLSQATHVSLSDEAIAAAAAKLTADDIQRLCSVDAGFDTEIHYCDDGPLTVQYLLVLDAINFCFWQDEELEYENLSRGLKRALLDDAHALDAERLAVITGKQLQDMLSWPRPLPLQEERARLVREVGTVLLRQYGGSAANVVASANKSAVELVRIVTASFPGFRDHAVYRGCQVFLYKRAQIFVGDVWGSFKGHGLGHFDDIHELTTFADYRVPVVLRVMGILQLSEPLEAKIAAKQQIAAGSEEEIEMRAATIVAVDRLQRRVAESSKHADGGTMNVPNAVQLDWWLWEQGERARHQHPPFHRTLTIFY